MASVAYKAREQESQQRTKRVIETKKGKAAFPPSAPRERGSTTDGQVCRWFCRI